MFAYNKTSTINGCKNNIDLEKLICYTSNDVKTHFNTMGM